LQVALALVGVARVLFWQLASIFVFVGSVGSGFICRRICLLTFVAVVVGRFLCPAVVAAVVAAAMFVRVWLLLGVDPTVVVG
jgi:hypothetical protein